MYWDDAVIFGLVTVALMITFMIGWVALYQGLEAKATREGMANATTSTVVTASLLVLGIDYVVTALIGGAV